MANYWQHRIGHEKDISYTLLEKGYLSIGWVDFLTHDLLHSDNMADREAFKAYYNLYYAHKKRIEHNLWSFLNILPADLVMVPLDDNKCALAKAEDYPNYITTLPFATFKAKSGDICEIKPDGIHNTETGYKYDLGFICKCKVLKVMSRDELPNDLHRKMHVQSTVITLNPVADSVLGLLEV